MNMVWISQSGHSTNTLPRCSRTVLLHLVAWVCEAQETNLSCFNLESWKFYYVPGGSISVFLRTCLVMLHESAEILLQAALEFTQCQTQVTACACTLTTSRSITLSRMCSCVRIRFYWLEHKLLNNNKWTSVAKVKLWTGFSRNPGSQQQHTDLIPTCL